MEDQKVHTISYYSHFNRPVVEKASGVFVWDSEGKKYIDSSCGAGVSCLGHGNEEIAEIMRKQTLKCDYVHDRFFLNAPAQDLAPFLLSKAGPAFGHASISTSGSMANEIGLKVITQYFREHGRKEKNLIMARLNSYHGSSLSALSITGDLARTELFSSTYSDRIRFIPPFYPFRLQEEGESLEEYARRAANEFEKSVLEIGPEKVAAVIIEPIVGSMLGAVGAPRTYFRRIAEICKRHDIFVMFDEVLCGVGRTGTFFYFEQCGITPDIITLAKGLGGGYCAIGATLVSRKISKVFEKHSFRHVASYAQHPTSCAISLGVMSVIEDNDLIENVNVMGEHLKKCLWKQLGQHPNVGDIRGSGLLVSVELVSDKSTKSMFPSSKNLPLEITETGQKHGLLCYPNSTSFGEHVNVNHILLMPPYVCRKEHIEEIVRKLALVIESVFPSSHRETSN